MGRLAARRGIGVLLAVMTVAPVASAAAYWTPAPGTTWQWQLSGTIDQSVPAQVFDVDGVETPASTVASLKASGRKVICYFSAGSYENWRPDAAAFPAEVLGNGNGWPGEKWLDIRRRDVLEPIMTARMAMCRDKGFDAVEPDLVDGYANATGFPLTAADQLAYNRMIAATAHRLGLSVALKNDIDQVAALEPDFDFAVNEECVAYDECAPLSRFILAGKAVFHTEYTGQSSAFCPTVNALGFSSLKKRLALDAWYESCLPLGPPPPPVAPPTSPPVTPPPGVPPAPSPPSPTPPATPVTPPGPAVTPDSPTSPNTPAPVARKVVRHVYACRGRTVRFTIAGTRYTVACTARTQVKRIVVKRPAAVVRHLITITSRRA